MARTLWEYRVLNLRSERYQIDPTYESQLNRMGEDGWELVSITAINHKSGGTDYIGMIFKRPSAVSEGQESLSALR